MLGRGFDPDGDEGGGGGAEGEGAAAAGDGEERVDEGEDAVGEGWAGELVAEGLEKDGGVEVVVVGSGKDVEDGAGGRVVGGRVA